MNRRTDPVGPSGGRTTPETEAPLVPDIGTRTGRPDATTGRTGTTTDDPTTAARRDRAERRSRRDPFELALMEDSE